MSKPAADHDSCSPLPAGGWLRWLVSFLRVRHGREILGLALPTVLAMLSQTLMWTVDTAILGRVSSLALAASGLGGMITWAGYSLFNNLSRINQTFVAQAHGRGDDEAVGDYTWQGIYVAIVSGAILTTLGYFSYLIMPMTGNPVAVQELTGTYIRWRAMSAVFSQVTFCLMGFFQGRRDVKTPMWAAVVANIMNLVLDFWLIFGFSGLVIGSTRLLAMPALGVKGAAIATSIGQLVNAVILGYCMLRRRFRLRYRIHRPRRPMIGKISDIVRVGLPAAWAAFIDMTGLTLFSVFIGRHGAVSLASSQITIQLLSFSFMPIWGIATAGSVLIGNWIGAGHPDTAEEYGRQVYKVALYYMMFLGLVLVLAQRWVFAIFSSDPAVLALGPALAVAAAVFQFGDGLRMVSESLLQGAGDTRYPMLTSLAIIWLLFLPSTYLVVVVAGYGVNNAWRCGALCYVLHGAILFARFRLGKWKRIRIFSTPITSVGE